MITEARSVRPFVDLDSADRDQRERGRCIVFDLHGLWWSVPTELTIHQVNVEMLDQLEQMDCAPFRREPWKARVRQVNR